MDQKRIYKTHSKTQFLWLRCNIWSLEVNFTAYTMFFGVFSLSHTITHTNKRIGEVGKVPSHDAMWGAVPMDRHVVRESLADYCQYFLFIILYFSRSTCWWHPKDHLDLPLPLENYTENIVINELMQNTPQCSVLLVFLPVPCCILTSASLEIKYPCEHLCKTNIPTSLFLYFIAGLCDKNRLCYSYSAAVQVRGIHRNTAYTHLFSSQSWIYPLLNPFWNAYNSVQCSKSIFLLKKTKW